MAVLAIRVLFFDLDGTLMPEEETVQAAMRAACAAMGVPAEVLAEAVLRAARDIWHSDPGRSALSRALGIASWEGLHVDFSGDAAELAALGPFAREFRVQAYGAGLMACGLDPAAAEGLAEHFRRAWRGGHRLYPEVDAALDACTRRQPAMLLTNGPSALQREKIAATGLDRRFADVFISGELGFGKPEPRFFEAALYRAGVRPKEALMIGDSLERDVLAAMQAGIPAVLVDRRGCGHGGRRADYPIIADLGGLLPIVDSTWA